MVQFSGTVNVQTLGWTFQLHTHGPSLVAVTLVTLLTVVAGFFSMVPTDRYEGANGNWKLKPTAAHAFNPMATMDVLLASSAGNHAKVLSKSDGRIGGKEGLAGHVHNPRLKIVLGMTDRGTPALGTVSAGDDDDASADVNHFFWIG